MRIQPVQVTHEVMARHTLGAGASIFGPAATSTTCQSSEAALPSGSRSGCAVYVSDLPSPIQFPARPQSVRSALRGPRRRGHLGSHEQAERWTPRRVQDSKNVENVAEIGVEGSRDGQRYARGGAR